MHRLRACALYCFGVRAHSFGGATKPDNKALKSNLNFVYSASPNGNIVEMHLPADRQGYPDCHRDSTMTVLLVHFTLPQ